MEGPEETVLSMTLDPGNTLDQAEEEAIQFVFNPAEGGDPAAIAAHQVFIENQVKAGPCNSTMVEKERPVIQPRPGIASIPHKLTLGGDPGYQGKIPVGPICNSTMIRTDKRGVYPGPGVPPIPHTRRTKKNLNIPPTKHEETIDDSVDAIDDALADVPITTRNTKGTVKDQKYSDFNFAEQMRHVEEYLRNKTFPVEDLTYDKRREFQRKCSKFAIITLTDTDRNEREALCKKKVVRGKLHHAEVVVDTQEQYRHMRDCHEGATNTLEARSAASHQGINALQRILNIRFYWRGFSKNITDFVRGCEYCQRMGKVDLKKGGEKLHPISIPEKVWCQLGVDLMGPFAETDEGYKYVMTVVDYFSKWVVCKPLVDKSAISVTIVLWELICQFGCADVQISDQGTEFVNKVADHLYNMSGVHHRITSAYHPQVNILFLFVYLYTGKQSNTPIRYILTIGAKCKDT